MAAAVNARRYAIGCACLLIAAAGLRFYDLPGVALRYDEIAVAINARSPFADLLDVARYLQNSPIFYPIALWAVEKIDGSEFGVRIISAAASLLTVGALLYLPRRAGVSRWAAFMAALLCALSASAIEHAQDAREYSLDTLCGALIIAGLLQYLRDGRKALLCAALFAGPMIQYGLVLFGAAALGAAALAPAASSQTDSGCGGRRGYAAAVWWRLRLRRDLLLPIGVFGAACAISWELAASYWYFGEDGGSWDSQPSKAILYYQGGYDAAGIAEFALSRTWWLLTYHMAPAIAGAALLAFGGLLLSARRRRRLDAVALLALLAVGIAVCAALIDAYPLGGSRHNLYLGPIVFLAAGGAFHSAAVDMGALARRAWAAPALAVAAAVAIAVAGAVGIYQYRHYLYYSEPSVKQALAALAELEHAGDAVYISRWEAPTVEFYIREKPANYFYGDVVCWGPDWSACAPEMLDEMFRTVGDSRRIWLIHNAGVSVEEEMAAAFEGVAVEEAALTDGAAPNAPRVDSLPTPHYDRQLDRRLKRRIQNDWTRPRVTLHLITGFDAAAADIRRERFAEYEAAVSGAPSAAAEYNLYLQGDTLYYAKRPCDAADTEARFFLHIYPENAADLHERLRLRGFANLDFEFQDYGLRVDDRCIIRRALPEYAIERIHAGQFVYPDGDVVWEVELAGEP